MSKLNSKQIVYEILTTEDLRSFYASVSCIKMGLDPLHTKLAVVGDVNRNGSIVLAATPPFNFSYTFLFNFNRLLFIL
ncbi:hypothetical protein BK732_13045 [Bacillus thuringiensis serovar navarrensis]|uniref:Uncharacterized protein n=1 Tax=Bacillus thuringiensis serovar navarrensis TaxID=339658 RepID=A0A243ADP6_BACTU|nr:hypothetical protein BK732_13045 [Bacillus thuringiensis serovar navarrensis]